jgi:FtsP/CotA-like multicopper oxidase with cupredoxin domain
LNGYNGSLHGPYPTVSVQKGDTVVLRLINNDSVQPHGVAVQFYAPNGIVAHLGETKSISFQATITGKFRIYEPIFTTIDVYEKAELDVG